MFFEAVFKPEFFFQELKKMFNRGLFKKTRRDRFSGPVNTIDILNEKSKYLQGDIVIGHCKGQDCIILFFHFEGFYKTIDDCSQKTFTLDKKIMGSGMLTPSINFFKLLWIMGNKNLKF